MSDIQKFLAVCAGISAIGVILAFFGIDIKMFSQTPSIKQAHSRREKVMLAFTIGALIFSGIGFYIGVTKETKRFSSNIIVGWGTTPNEALTFKKLTVLIDSGQLLAMKPNYRLAVVAFHTEGLIDDNDIDELQKSSLYDIREEGITIVIPISDAYAEEIQKIVGLPMTNYRLLAVPNGVNINQFQSLRQAKALGVKILEKKQELLKLTQIIPPILLNPKHDLKSRLP